MKCTLKAPVMQSPTTKIHEKTKSRRNNRHRNLLIVSGNSGSRSDPSGGALHGGSMIDTHGKIRMESNPAMQLSLFPRHSEGSMFAVRVL